MNRWMFLLLVVVSAFFAKADATQVNVVPAENQTRQEIQSLGKEGSGLRFLFVGNSITRHGPKPSIGWTNDCGMAASSIDKDYVHQMMALVKRDFPNASFKLVNVALFERGFATLDLASRYASLRAYQADVLVFFFGANVPHQYDLDPNPAKRFGVAYGALRDYLNPTGKALVLHSQGYYKRPKLDSEKREVAQSRGDLFVSMESIQNDPACRGRFNHPSDVGMERIAKLFWSVLRPQLLVRP